MGKNVMTIWDIIAAIVLVALIIIVVVIFWMDDKIKSIPK